MWLTLAQGLLAVVLYGLGILMLGVALLPGAWLVYTVWAAGASWALAARLMAVSWAAAAGFLLYGFTFIALAGLLRVALRLDLREGEYPIVSGGAIRWAAACAVQLPVHATFLQFILLTPFANLYYRMMGARIGRNVQIMSNFCGDYSLLEIGDGTVIGGHATVIGHSFERGRLILKKVRIGKGVVIGLNSVVLPGAVIGDGATVAAGAVVPKDHAIPAGATYLGPSR